MKKTIIVIFFIVSLIACSKSEPNLKLSNPEAFAFDLGDSWEVNASIKSMGFAQLSSEEYVEKTGRKILDSKDGYIIVEDNVKTKIKEDLYHCHIYYSVDLVTNSLDTLKAIYSEEVHKESEEELSDIMLEAQIEIDSTFKEGNYKLFFNVKDKNSNAADTISITFDLTK